MDNKLSGENMEANDRTPLLPETRETVRLKPSKGRQAVMLLACVYLHFMSLGFAIVLGVVYVELIRQFQAQRSEAALVQSAFQGLTYVGGILFSGIVTKYGVGIPVMIASTISSISVFFSAFSVNIYMIIILVGVIGGLAMSVSYLSGFIAVGWTFITSRRSALSFLTMATAVAQVFLPNVAEFLISQYSWSGLFMISGGLMLNCLPCGLILHLSRRYFYKGKPIEKMNVKLCQFSSKQDIAFILFVVVCAIFPGTGAVESWYIVDLSVLRGFTRQAGTVLLSLSGVFGLTGRLLSTVINKIFPKLRIAIPMTIAFSTFAIAHMLVILLMNYYETILGLVVRGLSIGFLQASIPSMQLELRGLEAFPKTVALCNVMSGAGLIICGYIWGSLADLTGGYDLTFYIASGVAVSNAVTMVIIRCLQ